MFSLSELASWTFLAQRTREFQEGILPWALRSPTAIVFDEYDAGRPDVMFVIQRVLETDGKLTLLDQNKVISPHKYFRILSCFTSMNFFCLSISIITLLRPTNVQAHEQRDI